MLPKIYTLIISALCISSLAAMDPSENQPREKKLAELKNADSVTQEKTRSAFAQENRFLLFRLGHRFDHDDLVQAAKPSPSIQKIVSKEGSTVIALLEAAHLIALNKDGTAVAIAHANKLKVLQKKHGWADDVYENTYRLPLKGMAFTENNLLAHAHNKDFYTLALKNKDLTALSRDTTALFSTISPNGNWRFIEGIDGDKISCALVNLTTGLEINIDLSPLITHIKTFAADAAGENFIAVSPSKIACIRLKVNGNTYNTNAFSINPNLKYIADADISADGIHTLLAGDRTLQYLTKTDDETFDKSQWELPFFINAARINPSNNNHIILGSNKGIILFDKATLSYFALFSPENESVASLAISADGSTIAAGTENAAYIINGKDAERSLSVIEHLLIKHLQAQPSEKVFESPAFVNIFKNFSNSNIAQKLVKKFSIDYKKLGYEECPICKDHFANTQTPCKHSLCSDCLDRIKEEKQTCPLCRSKIENIILEEK